MNVLLIMIIFSILIACLMLLLRLKRAQRYFYKNSDILKRIIACINSVRYGNLSERVDISSEDSEYKNLIEAVNRMIETVEDRENMILEYQKWMNEKNESLESLIKKEHESHILRKDFIAALGHDLKVPIIAESNALDFLLDGAFGELNEKQSETIQKLKNSNKDLIELVEVLVETYKLEDNLIELQKTIIDLNKLIKDVVDDMKPVADTNNQVIELELKDEVQIYVDPFQIKRVLKNIIFNSLSFSPRDSNVIIELDSSEEKIYIKVIDFGPGIESDDISRVFDKYYSAAKKFRKVGTGLGLFLANEIVKAHSGQIIAESVPYEKTVFTIVLPQK